MYCTSDGVQSRRKYESPKPLSHQPCHLDSIHALRCNPQGRIKQEDRETLRAKKRHRDLKADGERAGYGAAKKMVQDRME